MNNDFVDFNVDYDLGEKVAKVDGFMDKLSYVNKVSDLQRKFHDKPNDYPKNAAQKIFNKLEVALINNYRSQVATLRILHHYFKLTDLMYQKTPNWMQAERAQLKKLCKVIRDEERYIGLDMFVNEEKLIEALSEWDIPIHSDKLKMKKLSILKDKGVDIVLKHLTNTSKFQRQYKFPENVMLTQSGDIR